MLTFIAGFVVLIFYTILLSLNLGFVSAQPQINTATTWATNGTVYDMAADANGTLYIGGDFSFIGPYTGYGIPVNKTTAEANAVYPKLGGTTGNTVYDVLPDGSGGWYVAGTMTTVDGVATDGFLHILSDGTVDPAFDANVSGGNVYDLLLHDGVLYIGGTFNSVGGTTRYGLAAVSPVDGSLQAWDSKTAEYSIIYDMDANATDLFFTGSLATVSSTARAGAAAVSLATGELKNWNPNLGYGTGYGIEVATSSVFLGGNFSDIGGNSTYMYLAEVDSVTGTPTAWDPDPGGYVYDIEVEGNLVYTAGAFVNFGTETHNYAAAIDATTGVPTSWFPNFDQATEDIEIDGDYVYIAGNFTTVSSTAQGYITRVDKTTGAIDTSFDIAVSGFTKAVAVSTDTVYIGGSFTLGGGVTRNNLAAIDPTTGAPTSWNPNVDDTIYSVLVATDTLYVGGKFANVGATARNKLAEIDLTTGVATTWNPNVSGGFSRGVDDMVLDGTTLYIGGDFTTIGPDSRNHLGAVDIVTASSTAWNPNPTGGMSSGIYAIDQTADAIFVGGDFTSIGGASRNFIAKLDKTTASSTAWDAQATVDWSGSVGALDVEGNAVYAAGKFNGMGGQSRDSIAAIDVDTGLATAFDVGDMTVGIGGMGTPMNALTVSNGIVYLGGNFSAVGATSRAGVAAFDASTGALEPWNPDVTASFGSPVQVIYINGSRVYLGGSFTAVGANYNQYLAQFGPVDIQFSSSTFSQSEAVTSSVVTVEISTSNTTTEDITFTLTTGAGTATYGSDYTMTTGTFTILAGESSTSTNLTIVDDGTTEGDETVILVLSSPTFADLASQSTFTYTITNDDVAPPGVTVTESDTGTAVAEGGIASDTYTIVLDSAPTGNVSISVSPDADATVSTSTIVFTPSNWNTPVTVSVSAVNDLVSEGDHTATIAHSAISTDGNYNMIVIDSVVATVTDNDTPGITVTQSGGTTAVSEALVNTDTYTIVLNTQPTNSVTVALGTGTQNTLSTNSIVFTTENWSTPVTVTVTVVNDAIDEALVHSGTITHTVTSDDTDYDGTVIDNITVAITDDDTAGITLTESDSSTDVTEGSTTDSYTLVLNSKPTANVTVALAADDDVSISTTSIVFTSANWNSAVTVTVTGVDDATVEGEHTGVVTHTVTSDDSAYNAIAVSNVTATITDNDVADTDAGGNGISPSFMGETRVIPTDPTAPPTVKVLVFTLAEGDSTTVRIGGSTHTLSTQRVSEEEITFLLQSDPQTVTVKRGGYQDVDSDGDGFLDVRISYRGLKNNVPEVVVAELAPSVQSIIINNRDRETNERIVTVHINVKNVKGFALSNTSDFSNKSFISFLPQVQWELPKGSGEKTVYARVLLDNGRILDLSDTILFEETPSSECPLQVRRAYKYAGNPGVYYITPSCTKRIFRNARTFFSYFDSFDEVKTVSFAELEKVPTDAVGVMPLGSKVNLLDGSLVKTITNPTVYLLLQGEKRHIVNEQAFKALQYTWNWVENVAEEVLESYRSGLPIGAENEIPVYTFIMNEGAPTVYRLEPDPENEGQFIRRPIEKITDVDKEGYRRDRIIILPKNQ